MFYYNFLKVLFFAGQAVFEPRDPGQGNPTDVGFSVGLSNGQRQLAVVAGQRLGPTGPVVPRRRRLGPLSRPGLAGEDNDRRSIDSIHCQT